MIRSMGSVIALISVIAPPRDVRGDNQNEVIEATPVDSVEARVQLDSQDKEKRKKKKAKRRGLRLRLGDWRLRVKGSGSLAAGFMSGLKVRTDRLAVTRLAVNTKTSLKQGVVTFYAPADLDYRETFHVSLRNLGGGFGIGAAVKPIKAFSTGLSASFRGRWRPRWDDLYQPIPELPPDPPTDFAATDRYSYWDFNFNWNARYKPTPQHRLYADYGYRHRDFTNDSNFNAQTSPNHLTPGDHDLHTLDLDWRYRNHPHRLFAGLVLSKKNSVFTLSRDAGDGKTHAGPGGPPPNPTLQLLGLEPSIGGSVSIGDKLLSLRGRFAYAFVKDTYEGYMSYSEPHGTIGLRATFADRTTLKLGFDLWWRTFGPNSYVAGASHPPLEFGNRRVDQRLRLSLDGELALDEAWSAIVSGSYRWRRTNFPNYMPGVYPASRNYDIDRSYQNFVIVAGIKYSL